MKIRTGNSKTVHPDHGESVRNFKVSTILIFIRIVYINIYKVDAYHANKCVKVCILIKMNKSKIFVSYTFILYFISHVLHYIL